MRFQNLLAENYSSPHISFITNSLARLKVVLSPEMLDEVERGTGRVTDRYNNKPIRARLLQAFAIYGRSPGTSWSKSIASKNACTPELYVARTTCLPAFTS